MFSSKTVFSLLIFILFIHALATVNFWYWRFPWFDIPMHFFGGFWVAMMFFYFDPKIEIFKINGLKFLMDAAAILAFVALIGVFWEFFEFVSDFLIESKRSGLFQAGAADTLGDLFFDLVGGASLFAIYKLKMYNKYLWTLKIKK